MQDFVKFQHSGGNKMSKIEKVYNLKDKTFKFVDREDELDFFYEGFDSPRAEMSCGHAVTPMSLTNWCRKLLDEGKNRFVCGMTGCNKEWSYEEVCKMALLTPEEKKYFETTMKIIADRERMKNTKLCPGCKRGVTRTDESNLRTRCHDCTNKKGRGFDFCWQCLHEWKGPPSRSDHCENDGCFSEALKTLRDCPDIVFQSVRNVAGCPCIRACPTCGSLLQHSSQNCKNVVCPRCRVEFCFVCLKVTTECIRLSHSLTCLSGVAPRQTSIPVWHQNPSS
ncbi:ankyrin repeat and IBR domain-containing protein 1-like [Oryzias melastigma]|uniref:ankyrin repeat and IBR domain-containing protein 1-like n=1 Tax=Oryzias melastigma TaxID=30732 RepID=UPI00168CD173|nr:ankyrin repeat and IBR domain-containing protein 1-like [Oryzias melastigma]